MSITLLATNFDGRSISGATASNLTWITNGITAPGDLTASHNLFDTTATQDLFAVARNLHTQGDWSLDIPLMVNAEIALEQITLDAFIFTGGGTPQQFSRDFDLTIELLDNNLNVLDTEAVLDVFPNSFDVIPNPSPETFVFDFSGNTLSFNTNYVLRLIASGQGEGLAVGVNSGIDNLVVTGNVFNQLPVAQDDAVSTDEDTLLSGDVLADNGNGSDSDIDGYPNTPLLVTEVNGNATDVGSQVTLASGALLTLNSDGTFDYDPNGQFEFLDDGEMTTDSFTYTISDGMDTDTATVTVTINGANDAPTGSPTATLSNTAEDTAIIINSADLLAGFSDVDGDTLSVVGLTATNGSLVDNGDGTYTFTPTADFNGVVDLTYGVTDGVETLAGQTQSFNVNPVVLATNFDGRTISGATASNLTWITNGITAPGDLTASHNLFNTTATQDLFAVDRNLHTEGNWSLDIPLMVNAEIALEQITLDAFIFTNGGTPQQFSRDFDLTIELLDNNSNLLDTETVSDVFPNSNVIPDPSPEIFVFDFSGNTLSFNTNYVLRLTASGQGGGGIVGVNSGIDNLVVTGNVFNQLPVAQDDAVSTDEDTLLSGDVLADNGNGPDSDIDGYPNTPLLVTEVNGNAADVGSQVTLASGALLTLNSDGTFDYDPNGQFESLNDGDTTTDSFTYTISDGMDTDTATVTVTINGANDAPIGNPDGVATPKNTAVNIPVSTLLANDTDVDNPATDLRIIGVSNVLNGTATLNNNGTPTNFSDDFITFDPQKGFTGNTTFNYTVSDGSLTSTTTVTVGVGAIFGTPGADTITTGNGADTIYAFAGNDVVDAGSGRDFVDGGDGDDELIGGIGDDTLLGGNGNDTLVGDNGQDFLRGGLGNDTLTGGNATDTFVLAAGEGTDTFTDFSSSNDLIGLADDLSFGDLSFSGEDIFLGDTITGEKLATLTGVDTTTLTEANFVTV